MAEYIEKHKAVNLLTSLENEFQQFKPFKGFENAMYRKLCETEIAIGKLPAADVVPVVHGKWLNSTMLQSNQRICSVCKSTVRQPSYDRGEYTLYPYCPYCTAKMRENNEI